MDSLLLRHLGTEPDSLLSEPPGKPSYYIICTILYILGFSGSSAGKEPACSVGDLGSTLPTPVFFLGEFHSQRSLAGGLQSMGLQRVGHD